MKLAEALLERADLQKRIEQMKTRLQNNAWIQQGDAPAEDPEALIRELTGMTEQLEGLMTRINLTNAATQDGGETITALLARRDCLQEYTETLRTFLNRVSDTPSRARMSEIKILPTVSVRDYRKKVDDLSKQLRELDTRIQSLNWTTELI